MKLGVDFGTTRIVVAASDAATIRSRFLKTGKTRRSGSRLWRRSAVRAVPTWLSAMVGRPGTRRLTRLADAGWTVVRSSVTWKTPVRKPAWRPAAPWLPVATLLDGLIRSLKEALHAQYGAKETLK